MAEKNYYDILGVDKKASEWSDDEANAVRNAITNEYKVEGQLRSEVQLLLEDLNNRPFKKLPGCRRSAFEQLDQARIEPGSRHPIRQRQEDDRAQIGQSDPLAKADRSGVVEGDRPHQ